jgi:hypothetical protein
MCYSWTTVNVCFDCRVGFECASVCPQCGNKLSYMGPNFRPPKKRNRRQWEKIKRLHKAGTRFGPPCCGRRQEWRHIPKYLWQVDNFLNTDAIINSRKSEGEKLLAKINQNRGKTV